MTYSVYIIKNYHTGRGRGGVLAFDFDDLFVDFDEFQLDFDEFQLDFDDFFSTSTNLDWNWYLDIWKWYLRSGNDMYMFVILSPLGKHSLQLTLQQFHEIRDPPT